MKPLTRTRTCWMPKWKGNALTPTQLRGPEFRTKIACAEYIRKEWGYIRSRKDLRGPPHFWRVPRAVRVRVTVQEIR